MEQPVENESNKYYVEFTINDLAGNTFRDFMIVFGKNKTQAEREVKTFHRRSTDLKFFRLVEDS